MGGSVYTPPGHLGNSGDVCGLLMASMAQQFPSDALTPCDRTNVQRFHNFIENTENVP